eukprot:TRINITY_DN22413_c0_g2_i1.p1 TRINITY_DN22413_c0_g2~~TRINITY_DN22413_c0_g2_i1.p1  ORF type:complete len:1219 (+),score=211.20 TRINITY_DN22413_c0_g2_i1:96-3659(+)
MADEGPGFSAGHKPGTGAGKERRKERRHGDLLRRVTIELVTTYQNCSHDFGYSTNHAPRRVLTKLSKGVHNGNYDNAEHDYICRVGDKIVNPDGHSYEIMERLGHGTFGQVLKCQPSIGSNPVALKIIKNKPAYFHQALVEVRILQMLNQEFDPDDDKRIVRMLDFFVYRKHLCISFELLSVNLYEVLKQNSFRGVSMALIRVLTEQLLKAMRCLREASVIHCDLKPENVLLSNMHHTRIKLIDFGSACFESHTVYPYIQSRFYRSPEVLLGVPYTSAIDMWSLGCICAELFLGLPIFPGHSEYDQVCRIVEVLGQPPARLLDTGKNTKRYFRKEEVPPTDSTGSGDGASETSSGNVPADAQGQSPDSPSAAAAERPAAEASEDEPRAAKASSTGNASGEPLSPGSPAAPPAEPASGSEEVLSAEAPDKEAEKQSNLHRSSSLLDLLKQRLGIANDGVPDAPKEVSKGPSCSNESPLTTSTAMGSSEGQAPATGGERTSSDAEVTHKPQLRTFDPPPRSRRHRVRRTGNPTVWKLKSKEEYERDDHKKEPMQKKYFNFRSLEQMIDLVPYRPNLSKRILKEEKERRICFLQFLGGLLQIDPRLRWTAKQASFHPFIMGSKHDPSFEPVPDDTPSFVQAAPPRSAKKLPLQPPGGAAEAGAPSGGVTARSESGTRHGGGSASSGPEAEQPRSAPATTRGQSDGSAASGHEGVTKEHVGPVTAAAVAAAAAAAGGNPAAAAVLQSMGLPPDATGALPDAALRGLWGHLCMGIPLPDDNPAESYRPPIDKMSEAFFCSQMAAQSQGRHGGEEGEAAPATGSPTKAGSGAWSVSTGASFCSSASSTGSTPTGRSHRNRSRGSPLMRSGMQPHSDLRLTGHANQHLSGTTVTPASSPHGSVTSTVLAASAGQSGSSLQGGSLQERSGPRPGSGGVSLAVPPAQTPHRGGSGGSHVHGRAMSSRDGSRGSSPWHLPHLPSPLSEFSTASDRLNSSQPSGSDSCGENPSAHCNFDKCDFEDPSGQSDTPHYPRSSQLSDSDCATPRSHEHQSGGGSNPKDVQQALWENMKYEMSRVDLLRDRLPRRLDIMQSPGSTGALGNFREAVGMSDGGPVVPFGHGAARRDAIAMRTPSSSSQTAPADVEPSPAAASAAGASDGRTPAVGASLSQGHLGFGGFTHGSSQYSSRRKGRGPT